MTNSSLLSNEVRRKLELFKCITRDLVFYGLGTPYSLLRLKRKAISLEEVKKSWVTVATSILKEKGSYDRFGVYVHIPFCVSKCFYCNTLSFPQTNDQSHSRFLNALEKEITLLDFPKRVKARTVYIGGGTPSILSFKNLKRLMEMISKNFNVGNMEQFMVELSPYTCSYEKVKILKEYGVNKVTIGVQSLDKNVLKKLQRPQNANLVFQLYKNCRKLKIRHINVDLMAGVPYQSIESFQASLKNILKLKPDTIHVNSFCPDIFTRFAKNGLTLNFSDVIRCKKMLDLAYQMISSAHPYALEDYSTDKENLQFYDMYKFNSSVLGLGWGAISHAFKKMYYVKDLYYQDYEKNLKRDIFPKLFAFQLTKDLEMRFNIISSIQEEGKIDKNLFQKIFNEEPEKLYPKELALIEKMCPVEKDENCIKFSTNTRCERYIYSNCFLDDRFLTRYAGLVQKNKNEYRNIDFQLSYLLYG
ncbi:MAG: coproporphyrinogen-III oxidase family protein [Candidatus Omnitrophota bacterium]